MWKEVPLAWLLALDVGSMTNGTLAVPELGAVRGGQLMPKAFDGNLVVSSTGGQIAVTAIEQGAGVGVFTTLPVDAKP